jgi:hypothetical protein
VKGLNSQGMASRMIRFLSELKEEHKEKMPTLNKQEENTDKRL